MTIVACRQSDGTYRFVDADTSRPEWLVPERLPMRLSWGGADNGPPLSQPTFRVRRYRPVGEEEMFWCGPVPVYEEK